MIFGISYANFCIYAASKLKGTSYGQVVRLLRLLAHPARLRILDELRRGEACVCHLQALLSQPQPYVSQQLRVLREAGVIECYKEGWFVYYRLATQHIERLLGAILGPVETATVIPACLCPHCTAKHKTEDGACACGPAHT
ncbi:MAG: metalloregulator ArsR/SmtB family transcription factor [Anaerolineae bacterium]|nr:metalloregulator ArsR/SmtB family transcription factor [Anaerolineae bacterium]